MVDMDELNKALNGDDTEPLYVRYDDGSGVYQNQRHIIAKYNVSTHPEYICVNDCFNVCWRRIPVDRIRSWDFMRLMVGVSGIRGIVIDEEKLRGDFEAECGKQITIP